MDVVAQVVVLLGVICSVLMGVTRSSGNFIMGTLSLLVCLAFQRSDGTLSMSHENIIRQLPSTIEAALDKFNVTAKTVAYAVCGCHCTYAPSYPTGSAVPTYPEYCTHYPTPETLCGEPLLDARSNGPHLPKKTFVYHDFNDYLASLLSRGDIEAMMDASCDGLIKSLASPPSRFVKTPFEAKFLREFHGPKAGQLFVDRGDEGRYAFALHVDFFNPEGMSVHGASTSSGIISMACLNLPLDIRYKPENMYLAGIIPGPTQPSLENLNHYIRPLVSQLAASWAQGVRYSRTANYPEGRVTRSAVALAVCDLPAARHLAALAGTTSHFLCSACNCYHKANYGRTDFEKWVPRDKDKLRQYAEWWRDAPTTAERERLFKEHGVRYSELWRLPYWDPPHQLVVDSMHCILEGLVQHHVRNLLPLTSNNASSPKAMAPAFQHDFELLDPERGAALSMTAKETAQVSAVHILLVAQVPDTDDSAQIEMSMSDLQEALLKKNKAALKYVCQELDCLPSKNTRLYKPDYAKALVQWVSGPLSSSKFIIKQLDSVVCSPFLRSPQRLKMLARFLWSEYVTLSGTSQYLHGLGQYRKTSETRLLAQSKQTSGDHSLLSTYPLHSSVFGELVILSRTFNQCWIIQWISFQQFISHVHGPRVSNAPRHIVHILQTMWGT